MTFLHSSRNQHRFGNPVACGWLHPCQIAMVIAIIAILAGVDIARIGRHSRRGARCHLFEQMYLQAPQPAGMCLLYADDHQNLDFPATSAATPEPESPQFKPT